MVTAAQVAEHFLLIAAESGDDLDQLKLQKLCYYAQAFHLGYYGRPFFNDVVEAWPYGPAVKQLHKRYRRYGDGPISAPVARPIPLPLMRQEALLAEIYEMYGAMTSTELASQTHYEEPWRRARAEHGPNAEISHEAMRDWAIASGAAPPDLDAEPPPDAEQIREWANRPEVAAEIAQGLEDLKAGRSHRW